MADDYGILEEVDDWSGSMETDCYRGDEISWSAVTAASAHDTPSEDYDEIDENGSNVWRFDIHFQDRPKHLLGPCNGDKPNNWAWPVSFQFEISIADSEDPNELYFDKPQPEDDTSSTDEIGTTLDIIDSFGSVYTSLGTAVGDYILSNVNTPDVTYEKNGSKYIFDIPVDGNYYDLPREESDEAKAAQVSLRVQNEYPPGDWHAIKYLPEYTFSYKEVDPWDCDCSKTPRTLKTTVPDYKGWCYFESV